MSSTTDDYDAGYDPKLGYNKNAFEHRPVHVKAIGHVVKGIGSGIGLVSEAIHHQKDKRKKHQRTASSAPSRTAPDSPEPVDAVAPSTAVEEGVMRDQQQQQHPKSSADGKHGEVISDESEPIETDETDWALDELTATPSSEDDENFDNGLTIPDSYKPTTISNNNNKTNLPYPIILPQRRPSTKTRSFIHAYAPVLSTHVSPPLAPVDFNAFLTSLQRAARASPIFDAVLLTAGLVGIYPGWIALAVTTAAQVAAKVGQEMQERWQVNKALEEANREVWGPRGLWAMVVRWVPEEGLGEGEAVGSTVVDMSAVAVVKYGSASGLGVAEGADEGDSMVGEVKEEVKRLRVASGKTNGEWKMPVECAQLVFPEIDEAAKKAAVEVKKEGKELSVASVVDSFVGKAKSSSNFVNEYLDRRAAMEFAYKHPNSTLTALAPPAEPFKSRFSDPNAAVNKHLITMITGGRIKAEPLGARRRWEKAQRKQREQIAQGKLIKPAKRFLQEDVLYLMIVNMPTEEELAEARRKIAEAKKEKK